MPLEKGKTPQVSKGYVDTPGGQMHYRRCGEGTPTVLMLHAAPSSSAMFTSALPRIASKDVVVVALDLPNCGESYHTGPEPDAEEMATDILRAVEALGFPHSFYLVGHQAGATIALLLADTWPNRVKKLVLWGIPMMGIMERGDFLREEPPDYRNEFLGTILSFVSDRFPDDEHPWQLKVRGLIGMLQTYDKRNLCGRMMATVDHDRMLRSIKQPVLCLCGDSDALQKTTMKAALLLPNGKYFNLGPAGEDAVDEFPDEYCQQLIDFFRVSNRVTERSSCAALPSAEMDAANAKANAKGGRMSATMSPTTVLDDASSAASIEAAPTEISAPTSVESVDRGGELGVEPSSEASKDKRGSTERSRTKFSFKNLVKGKK